MLPDLKNLNLRQGYMMALAIIFLLSCIKYIMVVQLVKTQDAEALIINMSGRQRMLSQRIALFSLEQIQNDSTQTELSNAIAEFENNHHILIHGDRERGIPPLTKTAVLDIYYNTPHALDRHVSDYISAARDVLVNKNPDMLEYILDTGPNDLLQKLNIVVLQHEQAARKNVQQTIILQRLFLILTLLVLIIEAVFLFAPLVRRINNAISTLEEREIKIRQQHEELQHFTFIASHNLREPLRKITSFSQKLEKDLEKNKSPAVKSHLAFITSGAAHMRDLVEGLRSYAQVLSAPQDDRELTSADIAAKNAITNQHHKLKDAAANILINDLPEVYFNPAYLTQVFEILISNAINYKGMEPLRIIISCQKNENFYEFSVEDNGIGIPQTHLERIFIMFQRLHRKEDIPGTGAGLSVARKIIEAHGGKIWAESTHGEGSKFIFTIPHQP